MSTTLMRHSTSGLERWAEPDWFAWDAGNWHDWSRLVRGFSDAYRAGGAPSLSVDGRAQATYWVNGVAHQIGPDPSFPYYDSYLRGMNAVGGFVGVQYEYDPDGGLSDYAQRAFVIDANGRRSLARQGRSHSVATQISNSGIISGAIFDQDSLFHMTNAEFGVFDSHGFYSLDSLLVNKPFSEFVSEGHILQNDGGERLAGSYFDQSGMRRVFVADPVPEPTSMVTMCLALFLVGRSNRRKRGCS